MVNVVKLSVMILNVVNLSVIILNVVKLSVIILNVFDLIFVAPVKLHRFITWPKLFFQPKMSSSLSISTRTGAASATCSPPSGTRPPTRSRPSSSRAAESLSEKLTATKKVKLLALFSKTTRSRHPLMSRAP